MLGNTCNRSIKQIMIILVCICSLVWYTTILKLNSYDEIPQQKIYQLDEILFPELKNNSQDTLHTNEHLETLMHKYSNDVANLQSQFITTHKEPEKSTLYSKADLTNIPELPQNRVGPMLWEKFVESQGIMPNRQRNLKILPSSKIQTCSLETMQLLSQGLNIKDLDFCKWALGAGGVKVGKSYGRLDKGQRDRYETLNCNTVATGSNPSCDDGWGDPQISTWKNHSIHGLCEEGSRSKINCYDSRSNARFCVFENVMFDFTKMHDVRRGGSTNTRSWDKGFLSADCNENSPADIGYFPIYSPKIASSSTCDITYMEPVLVFSHDNIRNLGHTMSDYMNVWVMMWLAGVTEDAKNISFLNLDALRLGHNFNDEPNQFFRHYEVTFQRILKASSLYPKKVCFKKLIMQPKPLMLFTWDGWWQDMPCTFIGPSSIYQRWNFQLRQNYGFLNNYFENKNMYLDDTLQVLLVIRRGASGDGTTRSSRFYLNTNELITTLQSIPNIKFVAEDLGKLSFERQLKLIGESSVVVGMHGAGITHSMHMSIGTKYCCGVIEIFPQGEYMPIRGHGNMARRMGHHYARLDLVSSKHTGEGTEVPAEELKRLVENIVDKVRKKPTCVIPSVLSNPTFSN